MISQSICRRTVNTNAVILNWDPPSVAPDGYLILRRLQGEADYDEIGIVFVVEVEDPTTYTDDSLDEAGTYEYAIEAIFLDGTGSNVSEAVTVIVREEDLASPTANGDGNTNQHSDGDGESNGNSDGNAKPN